MPIEIDWETVAVSPCAASECHRSCALSCDCGQCEEYFEAEARGDVDPYWDTEDDDRVQDEPSPPPSLSPLSAATIGELLKWPRGDDADREILQLGEYNDRVTPQFHGRARVYLGWELELEFPYNSSSYTRERLNGLDPREAATRVASNLAPAGLMYLKYDGSLGNGIEFVTHPMSYEWALKNYPWNMIDTLRDLCGAYSTRGAGLHVHVNRSAFTDTTHAYRWLRIMWRMQRQIDAIARRRSNEWAAWNVHMRGQIKRIAKENERNMERYVAVNVQNQHTFEVRVFRSSCDPQQIKAALGLVNGTVEYTRSLTSKQANEQGWQWEGFYRWVVAQGGLYQPLINESERLGICVS